ncbi:MAG TPA: 2-dehydropantoate 2-reductase [Acetobacteraceae bacterium]|nr:2-dehydropantoate 2-reductase [Acetobacteraceae bacterium]
MRWPASFHKGQSGMKICVFGAGAIGGYMAGELALAGHEVCAIARGEHLRAIRRDGLRLIVEGRTRVARFPVSDDPAEFGPQDVVICALKAHQAHANAGNFAPLLGAHTPVLTAMNGIPWWYFHKEGGPFEGRHMETVDPGGRQWKAIGPERAIGCVVDPACEVVAPGVIEHHLFKRFTIGEPDGSRSERVVALGEALVSAGFEAPIRDNIRWNIWLKLWGNVCFNPVGALTLATLDRTATEPGLRAVCRAMMTEARSVAEALGVRIPEEMMDRRFDAAGSVSGHKISMLQDLERGRSLEIDALVTAVRDLGRLVGVPTPGIEVVLALVQERGRQAGLYGEGSRA